MNVFILFKKEAYSPAVVVGVYDNKETPVLILRRKNDYWGDESPFYYIQEHTVQK